MALVNGYGAMTERLWTTFPTVPFLHTVISTLAAVPMSNCLFSCAVCLAILACPPLTMQWLLRMLCYTESTSESALGSNARTYLYCIMFSTGQNEWTGV
jgi:hypothetical protein